MKTGSVGVMSTFAYPARMDWAGSKLAQNISALAIKKHFMSLALKQIGEDPRYGSAIVHLSVDTNNKHCLGLPALR
jgi:hypothetical protein